MEIVKKTVQIFERHEEVVVVSSENGYTSATTIPPSWIKSTVSTAHAIRPRLERLGYYLNNFQAR